MYDTNSKGRRHGRRRFLAAAGLAGGAVLAGCIGGADDETDTTTDTADGDGNGENPSDTGPDADEDGYTDAFEDDGLRVGGDSADYDCGHLAGSPTTVDPGDRPFVFLFDYPDTWEVYNENVSDSSRAIGSFVGHSETATGATYPINVYVNYPIQPSTDDDALAEWHRPDLFEHEDAGTLEYQGESLDVVRIRLDNRNVEWRVLLPSPSGDGAHRLSLKRAVATKYAPCGDAADEVAMALLESFRPNPDYSSPKTE